jgi:hypothetical protein
MKKIEVKAIQVYTIFDADRVIDFQKVEKRSVQLPGYQSFIEVYRFIRGLGAQVLVNSEFFALKFALEIAKHKSYKNIIFEGTSDAIEKILFHSHNRFIIITTEGSL